MPVLRLVIYYGAKAILAHYEATPHQAELLWKNLCGARALSVTRKHTWEIEVHAGGALDLCHLATNTYELDRMSDLAVFQHHNPRSYIGDW
jgi:hypothetical protein